jgi:aminopeptidase N
VLRGLSAPVKLEMDRSIHDLTALARFDDDGVNRWDAIQDLYIQAIQQLLEDPEAGVQAELTDLVCDLIGDPATIDDPACLSEMLMLPQDNILWDVLKPADPQAILAARQSLRQHLADSGEAYWEGLFIAMKVNTPYEPEAVAIGSRSLAITALGYLAKTRSVDEILSERFDEASNLTERFAAYRIARSDGSDQLSERLSADFLGKADTDEVLDLWLSTEAMNESTATIDRLHELLSHERFAWTNPNRVRAVLSTFANRNVRAFHTPEGYRLLADAVLKLDSVNPQIASRLVMPLCQWARFTEQYQAAIKAELRRMMAKNLSKDLYEMVGKSVD